MLDRETFLRPIAHRGLHDAARGIVENTGPAFEAAIAKGYGIECDLRSAAGGVPMVFHDETIERLIDGSGPVASLQQGCAAKLRFRGTPGSDPHVTGILTFAALLDLVAGRVPLLAEIKSEWGPPDAAFLAEIARLATSYAGPLGLMSFDPDVMTAVKALAPGVPRGIVSGSYFDRSGSEKNEKGWWPTSALTDARRRALANLEESAGVEPSFYAYDVRALPTPATQRVREIEHLPLFTWTVRTQAQRATASAHADAPIFEGFEA